MRRDDLRTLTERKAYDLLYGKRRQGDVKPTLQTDSNVSKPVQETSQEDPEPIHRSFGALGQRVTPFVEREIPHLDDIVERPTLHDVYKYFKAPMPRHPAGYERIVGEDNLGILLTLAFSNNLCFGIEGVPGSSKTLHLNKIINLLKPGEAYITSQATEGVLFEDCEDINQHSYLIFTELQKVAINQKRLSNGRVMECLKDIAEGREAVLKKVSGREVQEKVIYPKPFAYSRAVTNAWDTDREFKRRVLVFYTSNSPEQKRQVNETIYSDMHRIWKGVKGSNSDEERLREYIASIRKEDVIIFDPYSDLLADIIPDTVDSTCHIMHYRNMLTASAKFNLPDRMKFTFDGHKYVIPDIEDHYTIYQTYHSLFIDVLRELASEEDRGKLENLEKPDWSEWFMKGCEFLNNNEDTKPLRNVDPLIVDKYIAGNTDSGDIKVLDFLTGHKMSIGGYHV